MVTLRVVAVCLAAAISTPSQAETVVDWRPYTAEASLRFGVPMTWIERVMRAESNGQTMRNGRPIRSRVSAIGLMQLMPRTWEMLRSMLALGPNPDDPRDNILAGTLYLRMMYDRFGYPGMFAAYDAGPARYGAHLATGRALPAETIAYLQKVGRPGHNVKPSITAPGASLFVVQRLSPAHPRQVAAERSVAALFVVRNDGR